MLERDIERRLVEWCRKNGVYTRKFTSPANRGVPDRVCIRDGTTLFIELKRQGNKPTALQLREIDLIRKAGAKAEVATGWDETIAILSTYFSGVI